ncbi:MAG: hypothetical protein NZ108_00020 [Bacteroidia bacterium]|nr:hypothetical protein [Bacteroidia bacterium]
MKQGKLYWILMLIYWFLLSNSTFGQSNRSLAQKEKKVDRFIKIRNMNAYPYESASLLTALDKYLEISQQIQNKYRYNEMPPKAVQIANSCRIKLAIISILLERGNTETYLSKIKSTEMKDYRYLYYVVQAYHHYQNGRMSNAASAISKAITFASQSKLKPDVKLAIAYFVEQFRLEMGNPPPEETCSCPNLQGNNRAEMLQKMLILMMLKEIRCETVSLE